MSPTSWFHGLLFFYCSFSYIHILVKSTSWSLHTVPFCNTYVGIKIIIIVLIIIFGCDIVVPVLLQVKIFLNSHSIMEGLIEELASWIPMLGLTLMKLKSRHFYGLVDRPMRAKLFFRGYILNL